MRVDQGHNGDLPLIHNSLRESHSFSSGEFFIPLITHLFYISTLFIYFKNQPLGTQPPHLPYTVHIFLCQADSF